MIFWTRMGILVYVFIIVCNLVLVLTVDALFGKGYYNSHTWVIGLGTIIGGVLSSIVGFAIRPSGRGRKVIDAKTGRKFYIKEPGHTFMFIPMHWAGLIVAGMGLVAVIAEPFLPPPKAKRAVAPVAIAQQFPQTAIEQKFPSLHNHRAVAPPAAAAPVPTSPFAAPQIAGSPVAAPPAAGAPAVAEAPGQPPPRPRNPARGVIDADVSAATPPAAAVPEQARRTAVHKMALDNIPPGTREIEANEKLEVGTRVVASWGPQWDVAVIDSVGEGTAHVDFLRLGDGFNDDIEFELIRIPLQKEEIDPALMTTIKFALFPGTRLTAKDLPQIEEALLRLEGYVPNTVKLNQKSRQMSFVVIKESFADRFPGHFFLETKLPHGRQLKE